MAGDNRSIRLWLRAIVVGVFFIVLFYLGRPLYWKLSATMQEVRNNSPFAGLEQKSKEIALKAHNTLVPADTKAVSKANKKESKEKGISKPKTKADEKAESKSKSRRLSTQKLAQFETADTVSR